MSDPTHLLIAFAAGGTPAAKEALRAMRLPRLERLLQVFMLQKLFYELQYEAANRPNWLTIPLRGIVGLLEVPER